MSVEADIFTALKGLVANRVFPDMAPITTLKPYITYTQIGGEVVNFIENAVASRQNGRFQINVWADTRSSASSLMNQAELAMVQATAFQARPLGAFTSSYDNDMLTYGAMQDFTVWSTR